jgi:MFS family permease
MPLKLLLFLTAVNLLNYFDRYLTHSVEPLLKEELGLTNTDSGLLIGAWVYGYVVFAPLVGYLSERVDRRIIMACGLFLWSVATALTGFTGAFVSFFLARLLVGVGEASFVTLVPGYLKGRIPSTVTLNSALSLFYVAIPVGSALAYVLGGKLAEVMGWRNVFYVAAVPGALLAFGFLFLAKEGRSPASRARSGTLRDGLKLIWKQKVLVLSICGYIFNTFALGGVAGFVVRYGIGLGMDTVTAQTSFGAILVVTGILGTLVGGMIASRLASRAAGPTQALLKFVSVTTLVGTPFLAMAFLVETPTLFLASCFLAELALFAGVAPLNSVIVTKSPAGLETLVQGVTIFMIQLLGTSLASFLIGLTTDMLQGAQFSGGREAWCLGVALQLSSVAMLMSGLIWWWAARKDVAQST